VAHPSSSALQAATKAKFKISSPTDEKAARRSIRLSVHGGRDLRINFKNPARKSSNFSVNFNSRAQTYSADAVYSSTPSRRGWRRKLTFGCAIKFKLYRRRANFKTPAFCRRASIRLQNLKLTAGARLPRLPI